MQSMEGEGAAAEFRIFRKFKFLGEVKVFNASQGGFRLLIGVLILVDIPLLRAES